MLSCCLAVDGCPMSFDDGKDPFAKSSVLYIYSHAPSAAKPSAPVLMAVILLMRAILGSWTSMTLSSSFHVLRGTTTELKDTRAGFAVQNPSVSKDFKFPFNLGCEFFFDFWLTCWLTTVYMFFFVLISKKWHSLFLWIYRNSIIDVWLWSFSTKKSLLAVPMYT